MCKAIIRSRHRQFKLLEVTTLKLHPSDIMDACITTAFGLGSSGICIACGEEQEAVEPDARRHKCESCGEDAVYGAPPGCTARLTMTFKRLTSASSFSSVCSIVVSLSDTQNRVSDHVSEWLSHNV
jgi:hypothetical protein